MSPHGTRLADSRRVGVSGGGAGHSCVQVTGPGYQLAVDGSSFSLLSAAAEHRHTLLPRLAARGAVFARMKPDMKQETFTGCRFKIHNT